MKKNLPWHPRTSKNDPLDRVTLIGAGIAAWNLAQALQRRGVTCQIVAPASPGPTLSGASGNPQAVVMPLVTAAPSAEEDLLARCFEYARQHYPAAAWQPMGVLRLCEPTDSKQTRSQQSSSTWQQALQKRLADSIQAGAPDKPLPVRAELLPTGVRFPEAGWLQTDALNEAFPLQALPWITVQVAIIRQDPSTTGQWLLLDESGQTLCSTPAVVVAAGIGMASIRLQWVDAFGQVQDQRLAQPWGLSARHGQVSFVQLENSHAPREVILGKGYLTPALNGLCSLGATFDHLAEKHWQQPARLSDDHFIRNRALWRGTPWWETLQQARVMGGRAGIRAATPDHLPLAGPVIDCTHFQHHYADLHHGRHWQSYPPAQVLPGLFVLGGLGSRGFTTAPWLAEQVVRQLCGEAIAPADEAVLKSVHPNRFLFRRLQRPPRH